MYLSIVIIGVLIIDYFFVKNRRVSMSEKKGIQGEKKVRNTLKRLSKDYILINDLLLKYKNGTAQIDHVVICSKGIFVIETKNYSGKIYGDDHTKYWTQKLNGRKNTFYSPIWQNRTHINAIKGILKEFHNVPIYSVIVFCRQCNIKKVKSNEGVVYVNKLNRYIKRYKNNFFIKKEEIRNIYYILNSNNIHSKKMREKHIKMIKKEYI